MSKFLGEYPWSDNERDDNIYVKATLETGSQGGYVGWKIIQLNGNVVGMGSCFPSEPWVRDGLISLGWTPPKDS